MSGLHVGLIGATGLVGRTMLAVLEHSSLPVARLSAAASPRSEGTAVTFRGRPVTVQRVEALMEDLPDLILMSAGGDVSGRWAPEFARKKVYVIDNSSRWRMTEGVPLVVPEVNASVLKAEHYLIANPNCSTIQLMVPLAVIHRLYGIRRVYVSTYQAVSGSGWKGLAQLSDELAGRPPRVRAYDRPIAGNCLPYCGEEADDGFTTEEWKLIRESRKILGLPELEVMPHAVRVPVEVGHSEAVTVETHRPVDLGRLRAALQESPGIVLAEQAPTPKDAAGRDAVFVGRIRRHPFTECGLMCWIVADNLRKGAAANAVQIAEYLYRRQWLPIPPPSESDHGNQ